MHTERKQTHVHMQPWTLAVIILTSSLVLAAVLAVGLPIAARHMMQRPGQEIEIRLGHVHSTQWFNFTIHSVQSLSQFEGHTAAYGHRLWLVDITQTGTFFEGVPMGTADWFLDGDDFRAHLYPHMQFMGRDDMMPEWFWLERGQSEKHLMLFEAPVAAANLTLNFLEVDVLNFVGARFYMPLH